MAQRTPGPHDPPDALFVSRVFVVLAIAAFAYLLWQLTDILLLVFGAVVVATILRSFARPIARRTRVPQRWSVPVAGLVILIGLTGVALLLGTRLRSQLAELFALLPPALDQLLNKFGVTSITQEIPRALGLGLGGVVSRLASIGITAIGALTDLFLVVVAGIFLAADPGLYRTGLVALFPPSLHGRIAGALDASGRALELWLAGQLIGMALIGTLVTLAMWLVGLPSPLALGLIAGLTEFIPFLGPILGALPALVIAATRDFGTLMWTLAAFIAIQQTEANLIMPLIQRRTVALPPVVSLFAVVACGVVLGPLGLILAAPLTVVFYVLVKGLYVREVLGEVTSLPGEGHATVASAGTAVPRPPSS
jgi:predicted PurR-regulated permease PerM